MGPHRTAYPSLFLAAALVLGAPSSVVARTGIPRRHKNNSIRGDPKTEPINDPDCWCTTDTCFRCGIHLLNEQCIEIDADGHCDEVVLNPVTKGGGKVPDISDPLPPPVGNDEDMPDMPACAQDVAECTDGSFVSRDPNRGCDYGFCPDGHSIVIVDDKRDLLTIGLAEVPASEIGLDAQVQVNTVEDNIVLTPICVYEGQDPCQAEFFGNPRCPDGYCAQGRCVEGMACAEARR